MLAREYSHSDLRGANEAWVDRTVFGRFRKCGASRSRVYSLWFLVRHLGASLVASTQKQEIRNQFSKAKELLCSLANLERERLGFLRKIAGSFEGIPYLTSGELG